MGLGHFGGGVGVTEFLVGHGAEVTVTDKSQPEDLKESIKQLEHLPVTFHLGGHREEDFITSDLIVVNPAVHKNSRYLELARRHNVPLTCEMNIFFQRCRAPVIGVTGSNGKSTTAAMIAHILQAVAQQELTRPYKRAWLGGNIGGENLLCRLEQIEPDDVVVLELSSFQLHDLGQIGRSPHVAVLTNLTPNHLDWHGSMRGYVYAKQNIVRFQTSDDYVVLNRLDGSFSQWPRLTQAKVRWYPPVDMKEIELVLPGKHNQFNAAAALAAAELFSIEGNFARQVLAGVAPLPHRLELVRRLDAVSYYNDSVATTPESTAAALDAFSEEKILILGGYDKKTPFAYLVKKITDDNRIASVILIGEVRETLAEQIEKRKKELKSTWPSCEKADTLQEAVRLAQKQARPGMVVLLSPACASYDMFGNFHDRGEQFRRLVQALAAQPSPDQPFG